MISIIHEKKSYIIVLFYISLCLCINQSYARTIRVHTLKMPPFIENETEGVVLTSTLKVLKCAGFETSVSIDTWENALRTVQEKEGVIIPAMYSDERNAFLWYPQIPIYTMTYAFFQKKNYHYKWTGKYSDLKTYTIGKLKKGLVGETFDKQASARKLRIFETEYYDSLFTLLHQNQVNLIAGDIKTIKTLDTQNTLKQIDGPIIENRNTYIAFNKNDISENEKSRVERCLEMLK